MDRPTNALQGLGLQQGKGIHLHQQISDDIKQRIRSGAIAAGARLPSSRTLASQLAVSRATIELAYGMLAAEGYVSRRAAAGTRVESLPAKTARPPLPPSPLLMPGLASEPAKAPRLFQMGLPALDAFPRKLWSRVAARHARSLPLSKMIYQETCGFAPLRRAIANHLAIGRRLACSERQVFVTAGFLGALSLVGRTLLAAGDKVWIEDPGFPPARHTLELAGGQLVPIPVDRFGMDVAVGIALAPLARLALVTPAAQFPLGHALSADRRSRLMAWAAQAGAWVVEDDYETEFASGGKAQRMRREAEPAERVLHVGSFSNVLFPGLRLGYLIAPPSLVSDFERTSARMPLQVSLLDQMAVCDFIIEGHFARHLVRMRRLYAERRSTLVEALNAELGELGHAEDRGGMHLLLRLPPQADDIAAARLARAQGMAVNALSSMALRAETGPGLLLGFANLVPEAARDAARRLASVLRMPETRRA
jgi:GntR family transcriptional regulator/MocR family aminotransferase